MFHFKIIFSFIVLSLLYSCKNETQQSNNEEKIILIETKKEVTSKPLDYFTLFENNQKYIADSFDFPVGKPDAKGYYNSQKFRENSHLGDDWNGVKGGNSDLGDPIYSIANGYINEVKDYEGAWGNVLQITHLYNNKLYRSLYAHCDSILVSEGHFVTKGTQIATIGNCNGMYYAHLHLEIRDSIALDIGAGYSNNSKGYLDPTLFIKNN